MEKASPTRMRMRSWKRSLDGRQITRWKRPRTSCKHCWYVVSKWLGELEKRFIAEYLSINHYETQSVIVSPDPWSLAARIVSFRDWMFRSIVVHHHIWNRCREFRTWGLIISTVWECDSRSQLDCRLSDLDFRSLVVKLHPNTWFVWIISSSIGWIVWSHGLSTLIHGISTRVRYYSDIHRPIYTGLMEVDAPEHSALSLLMRIDEDSEISAGSVSNCSG